MDGESGGFLRIAWELLLLMDEPLSILGFPSRWIFRGMTEAATADDWTVTNGLPGEQGVCREVDRAATITLQPSVAKSRRGRPE